MIHYGHFEYHVGEEFNTTTIREMTVINPLKVLIIYYSFCSFINTNCLLMLA